MTLIIVCKILADKYEYSSIPAKQIESTALSNKQQAEVILEGSKSTRCEALTHLLNILRNIFSFYLSSALVKADRIDQYDIFSR